MGSRLQHVAYEKRVSATCASIYRCYSKKEADSGPTEQILRVYQIVT